MKDFMIEPYLLDKISVCFLIEQEFQLFENDNFEALKQAVYSIKDSLEIKVFKELKEKYFLIQGHKFGSTFLAYDENPEKNHAKALIFCGQKDQAEKDFNHMTRLAEIAKKECLFAFLDEQDKKIKVQKLSREKKQKTKRQNKRDKLGSKVEQKKID